MSEDAPALLGNDAGRAIGRSIAALHKKHLGKGPERVKSYVLDDCVLVLMYEGHTQSEATLQAGGEEKAVARQRVRSAESIHDELVGVVEAETGRKVIGYMSSSQQEPSLLSLTFVLESTDLVAA